MKKLFVGYALCVLVSLNLSPKVAQAQTKQQYNSISDALFAGGRLRGKTGPSSVNWINEGQKYSYISGNEIRSTEPGTLKDELIFTKTGLNFPGTQKPFAYESFQWSHDSRHLVFKSDFRPIYRRSGIANYYIYN